MVTKVSTFIHCVREDRRPACSSRACAGHQHLDHDGDREQRHQQRRDALRQPVAQAVVRADDEATWNRRCCSWRRSEEELRAERERDDGAEDDRRRAPRCGRRRGRPRGSRPSRGGAGRRRSGAGRPRSGRRRRASRTSPAGRRRRPRRRSRTARTRSSDVRLASNIQIANGSSRNIAAPLMRCRIETQPAGGSRYDARSVTWMLR